MIAEQHLTLSKVEGETEKVTVYMLIFQFIIQHIVALPKYGHGTTLNIGHPYVTLSIRRYSPRFHRIIVNYA